ncbi:MAG: hypothetical protein M0R03_11440 [Novosphingobium sp.]|nr:hypothetical protein [Novosphingobium sp.]
MEFRPYFSKKDIETYLKKHGYALIEVRGKKKVMLNGKILEDRPEDIFRKLLQVKLLNL